MYGNTHGVCQGGPSGIQRIIIMFNSAVVSFVLVCVYDLLGIAHNSAWEAHNSARATHNSAREAGKELPGYQPREITIAAPETAGIDTPPSTQSEGHNTQQWCPSAGLCLRRGRAYPSAEFVFTPAAQELRKCPLDGSGPEGLYACALDDWKFPKAMSPQDIAQQAAFIYLIKLIVLCVVLVDGYMCSFCYFVFDFCRHVGMHVLYDRNSDVEKLVGKLVEKLSDRVRVPTQQPTAKELFWLLSCAFIVQIKYNIHGLVFSICWYFCKYVDIRIRNVLTMMSRGEYDNTKNMEPVVSSDSKVTCPICKEYETNTRISCGHTLCYTCIDTHLQNHDDCPLCKSVITRMDTIYHPG